MVDYCYAASAPTRNVGPLERRQGCWNGEECRTSDPAAEVRPRTTVAMRSRLLGACGVDGRATADVLVRAVPDHPHPLAAVMALVDEGMLEMDMSAAFGPDTRFRRTASQVV